MKSLSVEKKIHLDHHLSKFPYDHAGILLKIWGRETFKGLLEMMNELLDEEYNKLQTKHQKRYKHFNARITYNAFLLLLALFVEAALSSRKGTHLWKSSFNLNPIFIFGTQGTYEKYMKPSTYNRIRKQIHLIFVCKAARSRNDPL